MNLQIKLALSVSALAFTFMFGSNKAWAQVGIGTTTPDQSAALELKATDKGFLAPRLTKVQRDAIKNPAEGLLVYQTDNRSGLYYFTNGQWQPVVDNLGDHQATQNLKLNGNWISNDGSNKGLTIANDGNTGIGVATPAAKLDVDGDIKFSGPLLANGKSGNKGQVLTSNGPGSVPEWKDVPSPATVIYNNLVTDISNASLPLDIPVNSKFPGPYTNSVYAPVPGLTRTITLTTPAKVVISCDGGLFTYGSKPNDFSNVDVVIMIDNVQLPVGGFRRVVAQNNSQLPQAVSSWAMNSTVDLKPGTYTISVQAKLVAGYPAEIAGNAQPMQAVLQTLIIGE